jgi:hypothetical protein
MKVDRPLVRDAGNGRMGAWRAAVNPEKRSFPT